MGDTQASRYQILVQGDLDPEWSDRLRGLKIEKLETGPSPVTSLSGELPDLSALQGVLNVLLDLHLPILRLRELPEKESRR